MRAHVAVNCKASSTEFYRLALGKHILPALGAIPVRSVERAHVTALHHALRDRPVMANRAIDILSKMFSLADKSWGLVSEA